MNGEHTCRDEGVKGHGPVKKLQIVWYDQSAWHKRNGRI